MSKRVLITGSSTGIGFETCKLFADKGYEVFAGVRQQKDYDRLNTMMDSVRAIYLDVTKPEDVAKAYELLDSLTKPADAFVLVNNAGVALAGPSECITAEDLKWQMDVNLLGVHRVTSMMLPLLRRSKGRVVNIGSISGRMAAPFFSPYAASKFALDGYTDSLRREVAPLGVTVTMVNPGPTKTPIWDKSLESSLARIEGHPALPVYADGMNLVKKLAMESGENGVPAREVADKIYYAATTRRPRSRYYVGKGIDATNKLSHWLPDSVLDRLVLQRFK